MQMDQAICWLHGLLCGRTGRSPGWIIPLPSGACGPEVMNPRFMLVGVHPAMAERGPLASPLSDAEERGPRRMDPMNVFGAKCRCFEREGETLQWVWQVT
jgi:hypothetical protein